MSNAARFPHFDTLRLAFAILVIFSHSFELLRYPEPLLHYGGLSSLGGLSVAGFFLISGYLITGSWLADPSMGRFLRRRVLRLYPGFIVASLISVMIVGPLGAEVSQYFNDLNIGKSLRGLLTLRDPQTPRVFAGTYAEAVNGSLWTISFEFRCYLLLLAIALLGIFKQRLALLCLTVVIAFAACYARANDLSHVTLGLRMLRVSDSMIWFAALFLTGSCAYVFRERIRYSVVPCIVAFAVLAACVTDPILFRPAVLLAGAYVVFAASTSPALHRFAPSRIDLSYGVYLYGFPVQKLLSWYLPAITPLVLFAATLALCLPLAALSWRYIELPALRLKPRRAPSSATLSRP
ncbi:acyltransferase [Paraburkholderia bonniea]|uniref:acyltransferase family protein n=1 Tax=Paraburkholderia bonniea TaxID=2152891 RepID=UPI00129100F3|nr:acyltransferase [Paraburkholderia bonniea]WJF91852.1 acyltransferase [Paraburkholderia bonniea]WJF95171.1 acyltransferase [Paraburkholderia bonniea]